LWAATAALRAEAPYPYEALERTWQVVLLQQFHDILPGSAIGWVHREAVAAYAEVAAELEGLVATGLGMTSPDTGADSGGDGGDDLVLANAAPQDRAEVAVLAAGVAAPASAQPLGDGRSAVWVQVPALGVAAPGPVTAEPVRAARDGDHIVLDNGVLRVSVDAQGHLASVVDLRHGREALAPGRPGNQLQLHPDLPNQWDAWDVEAHYRRVHVDLDEAESVELVDSGPLLARVRVVRHFGASRIEQLLALAAGSSRVDVETEIDWQEDAKLLKVAFPLDVHAEQSLSEVQFGHVAGRPREHVLGGRAVRAVRAPLHGRPRAGVRPRRRQRLHLRSRRHPRSRGRPVGTTTTVRLSLLRRPRFPDADADRGTHRLRYGLVVGGTLGRRRRRGYAVNLPLRPVHAAAVAPLVAVQGEGVLVEAVKLAEDRSGDLVVRSTSRSAGGPGPWCGSTARSASRG
jgi:alpha-mannosidase